MRAPHWDVTVPVSNGLGPLAWLCPRCLEGVLEGPEQEAGILVTRQPSVSQHPGNGRRSDNLAKRWSRGGGEEGEGVGGCEGHSPVSEPVRPGLNSKVFGSCLEP